MRSNNITKECLWKDGFHLNNEGINVVKLTVEIMLQAIKKKK